jgi:predicted nucleic acid-binding protein
VAVYSFDSSAVVKRYVSETGTAWVLRLADPKANNRIHLARITGVEVIAAIARRNREGSLSANDAATAIADFRYDFGTAYRIVEITPGLIASAMLLAETYALKGYDAVQLAAGLEVNAHGITSDYSGVGRRRSQQGVGRQRTDDRRSE